MENPSYILWAKAWSLLQRAASDKKHRFSTGTLTTIHSYDWIGQAEVLAPRSRTVVLRKVDQQDGQLLAYTDVRSLKAKDILAGRTNVSWCFWDPKSQIQFNAVGTATIHADGAARQRYLELPKHSRKAYATLSPPGTKAGRSVDGLPADWADRERERTDYAADNFAFLMTDLRSADVLKLGREGHERVSGSKDENGRWVVSNIVP